MLKKVREFWIESDADKIRAIEYVTLIDSTPMGSGYRKYTEGLHSFETENGQVLNRDEEGKYTLVESDIVYWEINDPENQSE